ncbi:MAG: hypothetical protein Ta2G_17650 [Termitinemataceae bacterium]|nr:MAG: hypothetical protein Ta2G_17650 [Termitinemataceae bacterium]
MKALISAALFILICFGSLYAEEDEINASLDWEKMSIKVSIKSKLQGNNLRSPNQRIIAEETLALQYLEVIRPFILSLQVDSSSKIKDMIERAALPSSIVDDFAASVKKLSPYYTADFKSISSTYTIDLNEIGKQLYTKNQNIEMTKPLNKEGGVSYSGIIIMADVPLPVHGKHTSVNIVPSIFPKIWDSEMNLIFDRNMSLLNKEGGSAFYVHYSSVDKVFLKTPSGIDKELEKIVGSKPLRIIASELFGITPTDIVIDQSDAIQILSSDANRKLLQDGRIAIIVRSTDLSSNLMELSQNPR